MLEVTDCSRPCTWFFDASGKTATTCNRDAWRCHHDASVWWQDEVTTYETPFDPKKTMRDSQTMWWWILCHWDGMKCNGGDCDSVSLICTSTRVVAQWGRAFFHRSNLFLQHWDMQRCQPNPVWFWQWLVPGWYRLWCGSTRCDYKPFWMCRILDVRSYFNRKLNTNYACYVQ